MKPTAKKPAKKKPGKSDRKRTFRKKVSKFKPEELETIDYKDIGRLRYFVTERGKIIPSRMNGTPAKWQRHIGRQIKRARFLALLPYVAE